VWRLSACLVLIGAAGCGGEGPPPLTPVRGKVVYREKPVPGLSVEFLPHPDKGNPKAFAARGVTGEDGSFTLSTYIDKAGNLPGAQPGWYKVRFMGYGGNSWLPPAYQSITDSPLEVEVPEGGLNDFVLTIRD
jgi:hypothetical protein